MNSEEYQQQTIRQLIALDEALAAIGKPRNEAEIWLYTALDAFLQDHTKHDDQAGNTNLSRAKRRKAQDIALTLLGLADLAVRDLHRVRTSKTKPTIEQLAKSYHYKNLALLPKDGSLPPHVSRN